MSKYEPLARHLASLDSDRVKLTFSDIESILGFKLPPTALTTPRWWGNSHTKDSHTWAHLWMESGWEKDELDLGRGWVSFRRVAPGRRAWAGRRLISDLSIGSLDAVFSLQTWGEGATLWMESRGPGRNTDYLAALDALLDALASLGATLVDVLVDSRRVVDLPAEARRVRLDEPYPIDLALLTDVQEFRRSLTQSAAQTARNEGSAGSGNPTKRLRMDLRIPGSPSASDLAVSLTASPEPAETFAFRAQPPANTDAHTIRSAVPATVVALRHAKIQRHLYAELAREFGERSVSAENVVASGRPADLIVSHQDSVSIYEIKTAAAAKDCVRQALGQLLEYAYWPGSPKVRELVVVGPAVCDPTTERFLEDLRTQFGIPISYRQAD